MNELNSALNDTEHMNVPAASRVPRVLIVTAVDAEKEAVLRGLGDKAADMFDVIAAGVGPASAAAGTAAALALSAASASRLKAPAVASAPNLATAPPSDAAAVDPALAQGFTAPEQPDAAPSAASTTPGLLAGTGLTSAYTLVVSAGIGGGFPGVADVGSLVVADAMVAADLGSQAPDGFLSVDELGFGSSRVVADAALAVRLRDALKRAGHAVSGGTAVTVSTATGTADTAAELLRRVPDAAAEGMEGFGVATAAQQFGVPALELRGISNAVGPRDRDAWRIKDALIALQAASSILREVLTS